MAQTPKWAFFAFLLVNFIAQRSKISPKLEIAHLATLPHKLDFPSLSDPEGRHPYDLLPPARHPPLHGEPDRGLLLARRGGGRGAHTKVDPVR